MKHGTVPASHSHSGNKRDVGQMQLLEVANQQELPAMIIFYVEPCRPYADAAVELVKARFNDTAVI